MSDINKSLYAIQEYLSHRDGHGTAGEMLEHLAEVRHYIANVEQVRQSLVDLRRSELDSSWSSITVLLSSGAPFTVRVS